ncbi:MAG: hypothetical protein PWP21_1644, partial [Thermosediminibacterales bacterium]|nr:hypothetical protein [Rikenellaceae bacterium]MDK2836867.1 hypothetical protein [Thermosediminibacterales bacterium]
MKKLFVLFIILSLTACITKND